MLYCSTPSAAHILPSFLKRRGIRNNGGTSKAKKPKAVKTWDRDVLCIPKQGNRLPTGRIKYPRGKRRVYLTSSGLFGKLHLTSEMSDEDVRREIRFIFKGPMQNDPNFPFVYLQGAGGGAACLTVPSQSSSFKWTPQQVARISSQSGIIYILAQADLYHVEEVDTDEHEVIAMY